MISAGHSCTLVRVDAQVLICLNQEVISEDGARGAWTEFETRDAKRVVGRINHFCELFDVSTAELCKRLALVGWPVPVNTMLGILRGKRRSISTSEVTAFAAALGVSSLALLAPVAPLMGEKDEPIEALPGLQVHPWDLVNSNFLGLGTPIGSVAPPDLAEMGSGRDVVGALAELPGLKWKVWNAVLVISSYATEASTDAGDPDDALADEWVIRTARIAATATAALRSALERVPAGATGVREVDRFTQLALHLQLDLLEGDELTRVAYRLSLEMRRVYGSPA